MSIINKPDFKVFADEAKTSEIVTFPDILRGWGVTLEQTAGKPPMEWFNALGKRVDEWLMYLSQCGIAEWEPTLDYPKHALTQYAGNIYIALDENKNQRPDNSQQFWSLFSDSIGLDKKLDKADIVQTIGVSADKVMSQKAVSEALASAVNIDIIYPVGIVIFFAQNKNPNELFPGTTWKYIGENRTVRLASATGTDVMTTGGSDSVTLSVANMPVHNHSFSGTSSAFDYGTKTSASNGAHTHNLLGNTTQNGNAKVGSMNNGIVGLWSGDGTQKNQGANLMVSTGAHTHTVGIGSHNHTYSGTTSSSGSGTAFSVINPYIKLMGWYRSE